MSAFSDTNAPSIITNKEARIQSLTKKNVDDFIMAKIREINSENLVDAPIEKFLVGSIKFSNFQVYFGGNQEYKARLWLDQNGDLFCFGLPKLCHETVAGYFCQTVIAQLERRGIPTDESIQTDPSPDLFIGRQIKQP